MASTFVWYVQENGLVPEALVEGSFIISVDILLGTLQEGQSRSAAYAH